MKILQINNNYYKKGGAEVVFFNTIDLLKQKGHSVISLSLEDSKNISSDHKEYFIDKKRNHNRFYSFSSLDVIKKIIENDKPDIVHLHEIIGGISFSILPFIKKRKIPIILTVHDFRLLCPTYIFINGKGENCEKCKRSKYYHCVLNRCSPEGLKRSCVFASESYLRDLILPYEKFIDQFIFVSKFVQNKFIEFNSNISQKSNHIYNFTDRFILTSKQGDYFLYFGRISREKGLLTLLNAFKELPEIQLKIAGEGNLRIEMEKIKRTQGMDVTIVTTARTDEEGRELLRLMNMPFRQR